MDEVPKDWSEYKTKPVYSRREISEVLTLQDIMEYTRMTKQYLELVGNLIAKGYSFTELDLLPRREEIMHMCETLDDMKKELDERLHVLLAKENEEEQET